MLCALFCTYCPAAAPRRPPGHPSLRALSPSAGSFPLPLMLQPLLFVRQLEVESTSPGKAKSPRDTHHTPLPLSAPLAHTDTFSETAAGAFPSAASPPPRTGHRSAAAPRGEVRQSPVMPSAAPCAALGDTDRRHPICPGGAAETAERTAVTRYYPDFGLS